MMNASAHLIGKTTLSPVEAMVVGVAPAGGVDDPVAVGDAAVRTGAAVVAGGWGVEGLVLVAEQVGEQPLSELPAGGVTVAVFTSWPVVAGGTIPVMV
jgi:hydrogenase maturation factor